MNQNAKREYQSPQIKQLQVPVENGFRLSGQNVVASGDNAIQFENVQGTWGGN